MGDYSMSFMKYLPGWIRRIIMADPERDTIGYQFCTAFPAATAMAQRADMLRGLSPRESSLALNYATGPRGGWGRVLPGTRLGRTLYPESALSLVCPGS